MTAELSPVERMTLGVCRAINTRPGAKALQRVFIEQFGARWVSACMSNLLQVHGLEHLRAASPVGGAMLAANHRSFFDLYVVAAIMWNEKLPWNRRHYYPVRSNFFYESWAGLAVNLVMGGGSMYPPIFRDPDKAALTRASVEEVTELLREPGVVVGVHPEGTRGKGPDPYDLLPAQPGVGQMAFKSGATVLPVWINGLSNDFARQILSNFRAGGRDGTPIHVVFGPPVDLSDFAGMNGRPTVYKRVSDRILADIRALGEVERTLATAAA